MPPFLLPSVVGVRARQLVIWRHVGQLQVQLGQFRCGLLAPFKKDHQLRLVVGLRDIIAGRCRRRSWHDRYCTAAGSLPSTSLTLLTLSRQTGIYSRSVRTRVEFPLYLLVPL